MSDIPLHTIRRQKPPERAGISYSYNESMPKSRRTQDSNMNRDERDDSDEEAGLLGAQYGEEGEYEGLIRVMSPVRCLLPFHISHFVTVCRNTRRSLRIFQNPPRKTVHEQYLSILQVGVFLFSLSVYTI
jgi:hypothetical protein